VEEYEERDSILYQNNLKVATRYKAEIEKAHPHTSISILDIGIGSGMDVKIFEEFGFETYGIDISDQMIANAKKKTQRTTFINGNFMTCDFATQKFTALFAQSFIHLFPKSEVFGVFQKMTTVLLKNGFVHFSTTVHESPSEGFEEVHFCFILVY
jgi:ubiquinone/menaquinone biosynthesis C-methylase UbiE